MDWADFAAFNGTLTWDLLRHTANIDADKQRFLSWLKALENNPQAHGIPDSFARDVQFVLLSFLVPTNSNDVNSPRGLLPIKTKLGQDGERAVDPVPARFGNKLAQIEMVDGPTALAYLFSIVCPPRDAILSWSNYWLPMLLLFSRCLFIAFQGSISDGSGMMSSVPVMATVMYTPRPMDPDSQEWPCMFGSTLASDTRHSVSSKKYTEDRDLATLWRRERVLGSALPPLQPPPTFESAFSEQERNKIQGRLHELILGTKMEAYPEAVRKQLDQNMFSITSKIQSELASEAGGYTHCRPTRPKLLISVEPTKAKLHALLYRLISIRYSKEYCPDGQEIAEAYQNLIRFYVTPCMLLESSSDSETPMSLSEIQQASIDDEVSRIWLQCKTIALKKLDHLKRNHELLTHPGRSDKNGRCAETHPVVGMGSRYFRSMEDNMHQVRGFAVEVRSVGSSPLFDQEGFNFNSLLNFASVMPHSHSHHTPCRYPCDNCRVVLSKLDILAEKKHDPYDKDIDEAGVTPH